MQLLDIPARTWVPVDVWMGTGPREQCAPYLRRKPAPVPVQRGRRGHHGLVVDHRGQELAS